MISQNLREKKVAYVNTILISKYVDTSTLVYLYTESCHERILSINVEELVVEHGWHNYSSFSLMKATYLDYSRRTLFYWN